MRHSLFRFVAALILVLGGVGAYLILTEYNSNSPVEEETLQRATRSADVRLLFIGNSFIHYNDMDQMVAQMAQEVMPEWETVLSVRVAPGGYRLIQHLTDALDELNNPMLRQLLLTGPEEARQWDLVVLQEQSQLPGLGNDNPEIQGFMQGVAGLHALADNAGAATMLYLTWGYPEGDHRTPENTNIYPDYTTMQNRLTFGTLSTAEAASINGSTVYVAPVGLAFQAIYDSLENPLEVNSRFRQLYDTDNIHPSLAGSYLAASVITAAYTGKRVARVSYLPNHLNESYATYLRQIADQVVFDSPDAPRRYPWLQTP